jgi:hypothetical protein
MSWQTPKTDWNVETPPTYSDFNRIEDNITALKNASTIGITDSGGYLAATNVEDALAEIYTKSR